MANKEIAEKKDLFPQELPESQQGSGRGNEDVGGDRSISRLNLLQDLSPQCSKTKPEYIEGAEAGMLYNTDTGSLDESVLLVNMYYRKDWAVFKKQDFGGGYDGSYDSKEEAEQYFEDNPTLIREQYDIVETAHHYCVVIDEEGSMVDIVEVIMSSTKLRISDQWNKLIAQKGGDRFSSVWRLGSQVQSGNNFSWFNFKVDFVGYTPDALHQDLADSYDFLKQKQAA